MNATSIIKIVYFDEETASDYLDIAAGGKSAATSEDVRDRTTKLHGDVETKVAAKFGWLPFLGASAEGRSRGQHRTGWAKHPPQDPLQHHPDRLPRASH